MVAPELKALGRYGIARVLGRGAMGVVYEGFDPRLSRRVAIKTILKSHLDEHTAKEYSLRFVREAQAVARLNHPNIVQVHDFGEEGDVAYLVMEFIRGRELKTYFDASERFTPKEAVRIMGELCDALDFAHQAGIVHRDVKPGNVMVDGEMRVKLTDFGVARVQDVAVARSQATAAGTMVGTPAYMSPEQIAGHVVDRRTDVFAAGIIAYQFLTGEMPFTGSGAWTIAKKIMQDEPALPSSIDTSVSPLFDAVIAKSLAKDPAQRFQSTRLLGLALKRALEGKALEGDADETVLRGSSPAPKPAASKEQPSTPSEIQDAEVEFWRSIKDATDPSEFELYLRKFPNGIYADLARYKVVKLRPPERGAPEPPAAPPEAVVTKAPNFDADAYIAQQGSKSEAIRALARDGKSTAEIARLLDIRYQHAYNVLAQENQKTTDASAVPAQAAEEGREAVERRAWAEAEQYARRVADEEAKRVAETRFKLAKLTKSQAAGPSRKSSLPALAAAIVLAVAAIATGGWIYMNRSTSAPSPDPDAARITAEKQAALQRAAKHAAEKVATEKAAREKAEADRAAAAQLAAEHEAAATKAAADRAELDRKAAAAKLATEKAAAERAERERKAAAAAAGPRRALLIGISQYAELEGLKYADADVRAFSQMLTEWAGYRRSDVTVVLNAEATKNRIMSEIFNVVRSSRREPLDSFMLVYAGHAMPGSIQGKSGAVASNIFLAPSDASTSPSSFFSTGREIGNETFINRSWLAKQLSEIEAKSMVIILDSAYSGTEAFGELFFENLGYSVRSVQSTGPQRGVRQVQAGSARTASGKRIVYLASSREDQPSAEYDELRHGALSYAIFESLRRARAGLYDDQRRDITIGGLYSSVTALFRATKVRGRSLDEFHQPVLMPIPSYDAVKDMPFLSISGTKRREAR